MPAERPLFQRLQQEMTDWLREPDTRPAPALERRRLDIYRELFFNNVRDFVETAYPVMKSLLSAPEWDGLVSRFFAEHRCRSPYFRDISLEFRSWMETYRADWLAERPWALELLHYEWGELAADCAETEPDPPHLREGDLLAGMPCLRQAVWPLAYRWPVHTFSPDKPPAPEPPARLTCLLLYRDDEDRVGQLEVNPLSARLVERLQERMPCSGRELLRQLAVEAGIDATGLPAFVDAGAGLMAELRARGIILGTRLGVA